MNAMIYIRGNRADFDGWRDAHGATGWGYDDVLPYFMRAEGNTRLGGPFHGQDGPLHVEDRRYTHELTTRWVDAAVAAGLKPTDDFNGAEQEGAGLYQVTCKKGRRWSVADAYLEPALAPAQPHGPHRRLRDPRIVVEGGRAVGVAYAARGREHTAHAGRRGGPLRRRGQLAAAADAVGHRARPPTCASTASTSSPTSPGVGQNLHDHPAVPLLWHTKDTTDVAEFNTLAARPAGRPGRGPLTQQRRRGRCLLAHPRRPRGARHAGPRRADRLLRQRAARADHAARSPRPSTLVSVPAAATLRLRSADPRWQPDIDPALLRRPGRPRRHDRRVRTHARDRATRARSRATSTAPVPAGAGRRPTEDLVEHRRGPDPDALPPGRHLRDGHRRARRRRPRAAGARRRGPARRRRLA